MTVVFLHRAGDIAGRYMARLELPENATLYDLLLAIRDNVSRRLAEGVLNGRLFFNILVDGKPARGFNARLRDGSRVVFLTPEMGG